MSKRIAIIGGLVLLAIVFLSYYPGLKMGFYLDDYIYLERAGRTDWSNALVQSFDPRLQTLWYRPLQTIQFFLEYQVFGGNANAYHIVNMVFHGLNVLLVYALAWRISKRWLIGIGSALFYATFPVYASGVNWIGIVDPLAAIFYLSAIWFWWSYLERQNPRDYALALGALILALLSKQVSVTLPVVLFLAEWWLMRRPLAPAQIARRYGPFLLVTVAFVLLQYTTKSTHTFAGVFGWQFGATAAYILLQYLVLAFFPWGVFPSLDLNLVEVGNHATYVWAAVSVLALSLVIWRKRDLALLFLSAFALLNLLPVLPFPFIEHRYLYLPIIPIAILLALVLYRASALFGKRSWSTVASSASLALLALGNGFAVNDSALSAAEWARQLRVPFRDIERMHPTYPEDTLLYFIDPITPTTGGLSGMFFLRYGRGVTVKNWTEYAGLREHNAAFVYYFDETRQPHEIVVVKTGTQTDLQLPARYEAPIALEGYEVARTSVKRGTPLVILLYWRAGDRIQRNYTVFVELVDRAGRVVAGYESEPRKGQHPTTRWEPGWLAADAVLLPINMDAPIGSDYRLRVGLRDAETRRRLGVLDAQGQAISDAITIWPFTIIE